MLIRFLHPYGEHKRGEVHETGWALASNLAYAGIVELVDGIETKIVDAPSKDKMVKRSGPHLKQRISSYALAQMNQRNATVEEQTTDESSDD